MALQVIGSGFGRTGTKSLKAALERLGFGPCHHMHEIIADPGQVNHWQTVAAGGKVDWSVVFAGYRAQVDWPGAHVWRDTARAFPHARIVHTTRPDDTWWASFERTIATLMQRRADLALPQHMRDMLDAWDVMVGQGVFGGDLTDRDAAIEAYHAHTLAVRQELPRERLLLFDVAEGWAPLCDFLGVEVPDEPFPHHNLRADFWEALGGDPT